MAVHGQTEITLNTIPARTSLLGGHFIYKSTRSSSMLTPPSANVVENVKVGNIDVTDDPTQWGHNVHIGSDGIRLRYNENLLSEWDTTGIKFYKDYSQQNQDPVAFFGEYVQIGKDNKMHISESGIYGLDSKGSTFFNLNIDAEHPLEVINKVSIQNFNGTTSSGSFSETRTVDVSQVPEGTELKLSDQLPAIFAFSKSHHDNFSTITEYRGLGFSKNGNNLYAVIMLNGTSASEIKINIGTSKTETRSITIPYTYSNYSWTIQASFIVNYSADNNTLTLTWNYSDSYRSTSSETNLKLNCADFKYTILNSYPVNLQCGEIFGAPGLYSAGIGQGLYISGDNQFSIGKYNIEDTENKYSFIIGNGTNISPSNSLTVDSTGLLSVKNGMAFMNYPDFENNKVLQASGTQLTIRTIGNRIHFCEATDNYDSLIFSSEVPYESQSTASSYDFLRIYGDNDSNYGHILVMGAGGHTIVGGGESASAIFNNLSDFTRDSGEKLYLTADNNIYMYSNCNTVANKKIWTFNNSGNSYFPGHIYLDTNAKVLSGMDNLGNYRDLVQLNENNNYVFAYGGYYNNQGESDYYGYQVNLRSKTSVYLISRNGQSTDASTEARRSVRLYSYQSNDQAGFIPAQADDDAKINLGESTRRWRAIYGMNGYFSSGLTVSSGGATISGGLTVSSSGITVTGGITVSSGSIIVNTGHIRPSTTQTSTDGQCLGTSNEKWSRVFAANGTIQTSDYKEKIIKKKLSYNSKDFIMKLQPVEYIRKNDSSKKLYLGLVAQDVYQVAKHFNKDLAMIDVAYKESGKEVLFKDVDSIDDEKLTWGLNYSELIAPLVATVQIQQKEIDELRAEVKKLKALFKM